LMTYTMGAKKVYIFQSNELDASPTSTNAGFRKSRATPSGLKAASVAETFVLRLAPRTVCHGIVRRLVSGIRTKARPADTPANAVWNQ